MYIDMYVCIWCINISIYIYTNVFYMQTSAFTSVRKQENRETNNSKKTAKQQSKRTERKEIGCKDRKQTSRGAGSRAAKTHD